MKLHFSPRITLVTLMLGAGLAATFSISAAANSSMASLPPEHSVGDVSYISGGIGEDEAIAMKQAAAQYPLELTFLSRQHDGHDAYKADDGVVVRDHLGNIVLDAQSDGPFLLAKLPPGRYSVEAIDHDHGQSLERKMTVKPHRHTHLVFEW